MQMETACYQMESSLRVGLDHYIVTVHWRDEIVLKT